MRVSYLRIVQDVIETDSVGIARVDRLMEGSRRCPDQPRM